MGNGNPDGQGGDTLESLKAERKHLDKTVECVEQMIRDFDAATERKKAFDCKRVAFHLQMKGPHLRRCVWRGVLSPEGFQWFKAAIAEKKALAEQAMKDARSFGEALVEWAEDLEKREEQFRARAAQRQEPALLASPSIPLVTGGDGLLPDESRDALPQGTEPPVELIPDEQDLGKHGQGPMAKAPEQDAAAEEMMRIDPPIASDPITESLTLWGLAGVRPIPAVVDGLVAAGSKGLADLASDALRALAEGDASALAPGGGLQASEKLTGHLLARHVGWTEAQLMSRAMTDPRVPGVASSFFDRATAEAAASQAIDANAGEIAKWLTAGKRTPLQIFGTMSTSVGRVVTNEGVSVVAKSSRFVLVRSAASSTGYYIRTGFPDFH